jgi:hypothetical protein
MDIAISNDITAPELCLLCKGADCDATGESECERTEATACQWFARCGNDATTTRRHPVLGAVPICDRCNARVEALS